MAGPYTQRVEENIAKPQDKQELYSDMILGDNSLGNDLDEFTGYVATGNCSEDELEIMRKYQEVLAQIHYIEDRFNNVDLTRLKNYIKRRMAFIAHSSKSRRGFGVKQVGTARVQQQEDVFQHRSQSQPGKKGLGSRLKRMVSGARQQDIMGGIPETYDHGSRGRQDDMLDW